MADADAEQPEAMDTQASPPPAESASGPAAAAEIPPDIPAAFPKKRRGRPPGRPNMTVREADYEENPLVQAWNAAKSERAMTVVAVDIRAALGEAALVHDTQRAIFRLPSREIIYFVQGWITARHVASQRPSYVNGLLIHSRGEDSPVQCAQCAERRGKNALGPFLTCRILPGSYHNSCSNCKWFDNTSVCSLYTGPKPNRKRKAKDVADRNQSAEEGRSSGAAGDSTVPDGAMDPMLQAHVTGGGSERDSADVQFADMQVEHDGSVVDAQIAAQLLPEIQQDTSPSEV